MKSGNRPKAEFVDGMQRRGTPEGRQAQYSDLAKPPHIDLRVRRRINIPRTIALLNEDYRTQWHDFLDDAGQQNVSVGSARALGSIGITYFGSTELNFMLRQKYSRDYFDPHKKLKLFRTVSGGITAFIRDEARAEKEMAQYQHTAPNKAAQKIIELESGIRGYSYNEMASLKVASEQFGERAFGEATLLVGRVGLSGPHHWGLDFSSNDRLYEERTRLKGHLKLEHKLDTTLLKNSWQPRGTFFDVFQHLPGAAITTLLPPDSIAFDAPESTRNPE